jgi:hypothetical protein
MFTNANKIHAQMDKSMTHRLISVIVVSKVARDVTTKEDVKSARMVTSHGLISWASYNV